MTGVQQRNVNNSSTQTNQRPLAIAGIVLGIGQAGFFDGIVLHQILQWHHMFSNVETTTTVAGLELNTLGDGLFHLFNWFITLIGLALLWRVAKRGEPLSTQTFVGALIVGFGLFNLVEGVVDHHLLQIHHVRSIAQPFIYDVSFLVINSLVLVLGWWVLRSSSPE